tara:strand:- start:519 stop:722 length:204 start_codon:yes stop_codon:yes gene_type:complete
MSRLLSREIFDVQFKQTKNKQLMGENNTGSAQQQIKKLCLKNICVMKNFADVFKLKSTNETNGGINE